MAVVNVEPSDLDTPPPELDLMELLVLYTDWPFRVNVGSSEKLEWLSDVLSGYTGEQRLALRDAPRQSFNYADTLEPHDFTRAKDFVRQNVYATVPVWFERTHVFGSLASAATVIVFDTADADYRDSSAVVIWESADKVVVRLIDTVEAGQLNLAAAVGVDFTDPFVAPARIGIIVDGLQINRQLVTVATCNIRFLITDNVDLASGTSEGYMYPLYEGLDVLTDSTIVVGSVSENVINTSEFIDSGLGMVAVEPIKDYTDFKQTLGFLEQGKTALWMRRQWLHSLKGKQKPFWLPSFMDDLVLLVPIGAADVVVTVERLGLPAGMIGRHIMLELNDGTQYFREITNAIEGGVGEAYITISSNLGAIVAVADVRRFSFISRVRLDTDQIEIKYRASDIAEMSAPVVEVPA